MAGLNRELYVPNRSGQAGYVVKNFGVERPLGLQIPMGKMPVFFGFMGDNATHVLTWGNRTNPREVEISEPWAKLTVHNNPALVTDFGTRTWHDAVTLHEDPETLISALANNGRVLLVQDFMMSVALDGVPGHDIFTASTNQSLAFVAIHQSMLS